MTLLAHHWSGPAAAPVVVLLHPIATNSDLWLPQVGPWSSRFRLLRVDLPGHGASALDGDFADVAAYARPVWQLLDAHAVKDAALAGISFGGMVAQAMALQQPARVRSLVLAHTTARTDERVQALWTQRLADYDLHGIEAHARATLARWFTPGYPERAPMTIAWVDRMIRGTSAAGYRSAVQAIQRLDHLAQLSRIHAPTLVIGGELDLAIPVAVARAMAERIGGARFEMLKGAAHIGNIEQGEAFTELVGDFLRRTLEGERV